MRRTHKAVNIPPGKPYPRGPAGSSDTGCTKHGYPRPEKLKAKFQIGSIHGRMTYDTTEKVFHADDAPEKAKEARRAVLASRKPQPNKPFTVCTSNGTLSGKSIAPWDNTQKRITKSIRNHKTSKKAPKPEAKGRMYCRVGTWNPSNFVEKSVEGTFSNIRLDPGEEQKGFYSVAPETTEQVLKIAVNKRKSLIQIEKERLERRRAKEREARAKMKFEKECQEKVPFHIKPKTKPDYKRIGKMIDMAVRPDTLANFLKQQEKSKEKVEKLRTKQADLMATHDIIWTPQYAVKGARLSYSVKPGQSLSDTKFFLTGKPEKKFPSTFKYKPGDIERKYHHPGKWGHSSIEECEVWSCCMNTERESRGCEVLEVINHTSWQYD
ncbi:hypothetical protein AAMO2058_000224500 [Amorphochlora amoebiformis]